MIRTKDIGSLTDFRQNAKRHLDELAKTRGVRVLTVNGEARGVVMSPEVFDEISESDEAYHAQVLAKIKQGMAEIKAGKGVDARQAMRELAEEFDIRLPE